MIKVRSSPLKSSSHVASSLAWIFSTFLRGESSLVGTIYLEVSITMAFEVRLTPQPLWWLTSNLFILVKGFDGCSVNVNPVVGGATLRGTLRENRSSLTWSLTFKLLFNIDRSKACRSADKLNNINILVIIC